MSKASHLTSDPARLVANMCHGKMGTTYGSTAAAKIDALTAAVGSINGTLYTLAAQDELVLAALAAANLPSAQANWRQPSGLDGAFYDQPAGTTVYYVLGFYDASGTATFKLVQGTFDPVAAQSTTLDPMQVSASGGIIFGGNSLAGKSVIPDVPNGFTPTAVLKVASGAAKFVPGTTALNGGTATVTFKDVSVLPVGGTF